MGGLLVEIRRPGYVRAEPGIGETLRYGTRALNVPLIEARGGARLAHAFPCGLGAVFAHGLIDPVDSQFGSLSWRRMSLPGGRIWSGCLGAEPDGRTDHQSQADDPHEHPFGDWSEVAQIQAAGVLVLVQIVQIADDVVLVRRGKVLVVEDWHRLGPGRHRLVDVLSGDVAQTGRVLAPRERATGAGEVVTHGAVFLEELVARGAVAIAGGVRAVGYGRASAQRGHVCGPGGHLLGREHHP